MSAAAAPVAPLLTIAAPDETAVDKHSRCRSLLVIGPGTCSLRHKIEVKVTAYIAALVVSMMRNPQS